MATKKDHLRYRYGICLNDNGACSKAKSKEVQQIVSRKDFVCEECQKPLRECPPPKSFWNKYGKLLIGAAGIVVAAAIVLCIFNKPSKSLNPPDTVIVTVPVERIMVDSAEYHLALGSICTIEVSVVPADATDTGLVWTSSDPDIASVSDGMINTLKEGVAFITVKSNDGKAQSTVTVIVDPVPELEGEESDLDLEEEEPTPVGQPLPKITVPFGIYSGPANGLDGEIKVTRKYTLDLRNAAHDTIELLPGDIITRTKFKDGELVGGYWRRGSESRSFHR